MLRESACETMKLPSRSIHVRCRFRIVQSKQLKPELFGMPGLNACFRSRAEKSFHPTVAEALDHSVYRIDTRYTCQARYNVLYGNF